MARCILAHAGIAVLVAVLLWILAFLGIVRYGELAGGVPPADGGAGARVTIAPV